MDAETKIELNKLKTDVLKLRKRVSALEREQAAAFVKRTPSQRRK